MNREFIIQELKPSTYCNEENRLTLLLKENEILMLYDFDGKIMFTYFINKEFIYSNIVSEEGLIERFKPNP